MRRIITLLVVGLLFSCSVDEEIIQPEDQIDQKFTVTIANDCVANVFNFPSGGSVAITNDSDKIYITVSTNDGFEVAKVNFQVTDTSSELPMENNGDLNPQKLSQRKLFNKGIHSYTFEIDWQASDKAVIAIYATFKQKSGPTVSGWAGDIPGDNGKWSYLAYEKCTPQADHCSYYSAGAANSNTITLGKAGAIESWDEVRKFYINLLEEGIPKDGTFDPSIWDIIKDFNSRENQLGDYPTTYTITNGECTASVILTMTVIAD